MNTIRAVLRWSVGVLCGVAALPAIAQGFPNKIVDIVVPYPAGGPSDYVARQIQPGLGKALGQTVLVENVGGAAGSIGIQKVLSAPHDGTMLALATPMEMVLAPLSTAAVKFKPEDLKVVARVGGTSMVLLTRKDLPANNIQELIALATKPGAKPLSYGSVGPGSLYHLAGEKFSKLVSARMLHVPYKGAAPLLTDLMGSQIDMVFMPLAGGTPNMIAEGKVKAMGVTSRTPHPKFSQLPTLPTHKGLEELTFDIWSGFAVPANTPADAATRLNKAIYDVLQNASVRDNLESTGSMVSAPMGVDELARMYGSEIARYRAMAKAIDLQAQ